MLKILVPMCLAGIVYAAPISSVYQQKCANCHGLKGEKAAMAKSVAINGLPAEKIEKALYDLASGERKAIPVVKNMKKSFVEANTKEQVHALAEYISAL